MAARGAQPRPSATPARTRRSRARIRAALAFALVAALGVVLAREVLRGRAAHRERERARAAAGALPAVDVSCAALRLGSWTQHRDRRVRFRAWVYAPASPSPDGVHVELVYGCERGPYAITGTATFARGARAPEGERAGTGIVIEGVVEGFNELTGVQIRDAVRVGESVPPG